MSRTNYYSGYMVNEARLERECEVQSSRDHDYAMPGEPRDGYVTKLLTSNRYTTRGGIGDFLATDWGEKLCNTLCSIHDFFEDEDHHCRMPKDVAELERVARLFRETYIAYFIYCAIKDVQSGYSASIFHYIGELLPGAYFLSDRWGLCNPKQTEDGEGKLARQLWDVFMDRVYSRSDKFNFTNFVTANSALSMLEDIYDEREAHKEDEHKTKREELEGELGLLREEENKREVEEYLNGKNNNR